MRGLDQLEAFIIGVGCGTLFGFGATAIAISGC
jgi:hypothetical protein